VPHHPHSYIVVTAFNGKQAIGPESAKALGYDAAEINALPHSLTESFAGVGNPRALGEFRAGDTVLDLGCGAGMDSIPAARQVGPSGRVIGVDMTEQMVHGWTGYRTSGCTQGGPVTARKPLERRLVRRPRPP